MELFLLFGDDYVSDPKLGGVCHQKRSNFEMSIPGELRRKMYRSFAANGLEAERTGICQKKKMNSQHWKDRKVLITGSSGVIGTGDGR